MCVCVCVCKVATRVSTLQVKTVRGRNFIERSEGGREDSDSGRELVNVGGKSSWQPPDPRGKLT